MPAVLALSMTFRAFALAVFPKFYDLSIEQEVTSRFHLHMKDK